MTDTTQTTYNEAARALIDEIPMKSRHPGHTMMPDVASELKEHPFAGLTSSDRTTRPLVNIASDVLYVLSSGRSKGEVRRAVVTRLFGTPTPTYTPAINILVFTDCTNDFERGEPGAGGAMWATSVKYSEGREPGTWHWPT